MSRPAGSRRRAWGVAATLVVLALAADLARPASRQVSASALVASIDLYRRSLSTRLADGGVRCRFHPSCSRYAREAIRRHGALAGGARSLLRLARCGPWTPAGTVDPL